MTDQPATTDTISRHEFPFAQIPHALIEDTGLSHPAVRVYAYLMRRADNATGNAFPGQRFIAKEIGMSPSTVTKAVTDLEQRGWLEVTRRRTAKKESLANHYLVRTTRGGVPNTGTPVPAIVTGGVPPSGTELDEDLTRPIELELAAVAAIAVPDDYQTRMKNAIVAAMGWNPAEVTAPQWGAVEKAGKHLRDIDADPDQAAYRAKVYRVNMPPGTLLTPTALAKHWAECAEPRRPTTRDGIETLFAQEESARWIAETEASERALT